jgi:AbrB family looped-hinge helix DNA binding protein
MSGLAEAPEPFSTAPSVAQVKVGPDGRILIPAAMRRAAGLEPGATVVVDLTNGLIRIGTFANRLKAAQDLIAHLVKPGVGMVDEFIAEKRAAAERGE